MWQLTSEQEALQQRARELAREMLLADLETMRSAPIGRGG